MRIAFLNWRDSTHPEGGGAEKYAETVCTGLAARGHEVTLFCARHAASAALELKDGVRYARQGGRVGVYAASLRRLRAVERAEGAFDVVVDTQNGVPFAAPLATRSPVVVLVHHVHREQWPIVFGPAAARVGWVLESRVAPRFYRGRQYVAVSQETKAELVELGVRARDIAVIHNGTDAPIETGTPRAGDPRLVVLGRLVPHKRVEHAVEVLARLLPRHPRLSLHIVGDGWWADEIRRAASERGVEDQVRLLGHVDEVTKNRELAEAWVALAPSVKEGWGLCVVEAASHGTPTVAYSGSGGLSESIVDGWSGVLVDGLDAMVSTIDTLLRDPGERARMGAAARDHAALFSWDRTVEAWEALLARVVRGEEHTGMTDDFDHGPAPR
ncbi:Glycosyl transferase, group 1 [Phycicoccus elongatus Lp2]|uniref:Glycosyl transferase, group 1 n=1 Tax=Phycicoccus elongatus Lp2 TaxID=1193181 RepID=N0E0B2_9MICO|nr:glycosyltransferase family 4 protein [Phycicoccus elongatus]CCH69166.1 Glycosyl transferase, group 1 [Phycicoccus elongatus Lp2]